MLLKVGDVKCCNAGFSHRASSSVYLSRIGQFFLSYKQNSFMFSWDKSHVFCTLDFVN